MALIWSQTILQFYAPGGVIIRGTMGCGGPVINYVAIESWRIEI